MHYNQFGTFQSTISESDREVLHITDVKAIQNMISTSGEKARHVTVEDKVIQGQATIKNGAITEANSDVVDLMAVNTKACISAALQHVKNAELALYPSESSTQALARSLCKARQYLEEGWQDT